MLVYDHCFEGRYMGKLIGNNIFNLNFFQKLKSIANSQLF